MWPHTPSGTPSYKIWAVDAIGQEIHIISNEEKKQVICHFERTQTLKYCNDPEFSDRIVQTWVNLIRNYSVCHATCIIWTHHGGIKLQLFKFWDNYIQFFGCDCLIFSSPDPSEPKAHRWAYSISRCPSSVRPSTFSNDMSTEAMERILTKFHI